MASVSADLQGSLGRWNMSPGFQIVAVIEAHLPQGRVLHGRFFLGGRGLYLRARATQASTQRVQLECHYGTRAPKTIFGMAFGT